MSDDDFVLSSKAYGELIKACTDAEKERDQLRKENKRLNGELEARWSLLQHHSTEMARLRSKVESLHDTLVERDRVLGVALRALEAANSMPICASCNEVPKALELIRNTLCAQSPQINKVLEDK